MNPFLQRPMSLTDSLSNWQQMYPRSYNKNEVDSDMENKLVVTSGGGGAIKGWGRRRYKLLHVK